MIFLGLVVPPLGCSTTRPMLPSDPTKPIPLPLREGGDLPEIPLPQPPPPKPLDVKPVVAEAPPVAVRTKPLNILCVSGGGAYGAYTSGVLNGWSRSNNRPTFDVVTGISTGALIAPLAFLGPQYDPEMRMYYTEVRQRDVFSIRSWATIPFRDAVASSAPLRRMIDNAITEDAIKEIAAEHRKGRRLYIGTTHLETRKTVVWDIGAIASKGGLDARKQILDVLVASCSVPGVFPPMPITMMVDGKPITEMHVDGGVTTSIFVPSAVFDAIAKEQKNGDLPGSKANLFAIVSGKYYPTQAPVKPKVIKLLKASGGAILHAQLRRDLANLALTSKLSGATYHSLALRQDFPIDDAALEFDQKVMNQLFVEGLKIGLEGPSWDSNPPERSGGDDEIRSGSRMLPTKP